MSAAPILKPPGPTHFAVRACALESGFTEAGWVALPHPEAERDARRFAQWIDQGRAAEMTYLQRRDEAGSLLRGDPKLPFPWAQSAIVCLASYHADGSLSVDEARPGAGWIARYAWTGKRDSSGNIRPSDYHRVLLKRLRRLEVELHKQFGAFESRAYVDTGPVVERSLARAAGLGWTGKNTCLIHPKFGSWSFLAVLLTSLPVAVESSSESGQREGPMTIPDRCGSCRRCIDACPTGALVEPYQMDANLCISYLTIEHRGPVPEALRAGMGRQVFGCDICQDVCPWNRKAPIGIGVDPDMTKRDELVNPQLDWLAALDFAGFERLFNGSPVRRAGFAGLRRNLAIAMGNSGLSRFLPRLREWAQAVPFDRARPTETQTDRQTGGVKTPDPGTLREAAKWAIGNIEDAMRGKRVDGANLADRADSHDHQL